MWGNDFKAELSKGRREPRFLLMHVGIPSNVLRPYGNGPRLSSFPLPGWDPIIRASGSSVSGGLLSVRDWTCTPLTFTVGITDGAVRDLRTHLQRNQAVALKVGWGNDPTEFTTVALGTIDGVSLTSAGWVIRCKGLEGALLTRFTSTAGEQALGYDLVSTTTDGSVTNGAATIDVDDATGLETAGVVQITANDGTTYLVSYTGISTNTLTGCTTPAFGTTWSATGSGRDVDERMYTNAHPLAVAARVLASTGNATNGVYDTLPASWGLGIPHGHLAERDIDRHITLRQPSSGADDWQWIQAATNNVQSTLSAWLAGGGYYLTQTQGALTARGGVLPWETTAGAGVVLRDRDVVSIDGYETWDPDQPVEYRFCRITDASGTNENSAVSPLDHLPAIGTNTHSPGGIYSTTPNRSAIIAELIATLKWWDLRTPEWLSLTLLGRWWGHLTPGDGLILDLSMLTSRTGGRFSPALVTRAAVDWFGREAVTRVELLILPQDESTTWRT